jgi:peptidoglycan hydrolase-like protein with peptidoglycan-binding domain
VAALQYLLARCEISAGAIDGVFGGLTRTAVSRYQRRAGLMADGVAGEATIGRLRGGRSVTS